MEIEVSFKGNTIFTGPWQQAPQPVRDYIGSALEMYGDGLRDYLIARPDPLALLYKGYAYKVIS